MKYITLIIGLLVVGCGKQEQTLTLEEKVVGEYEWKEDGDTLRVVILENGTAEGYKYGKKQEVDFKWSISEAGKLHVEAGDGIILVYRINKDKSITAIGIIDKDGKRTAHPKQFQFTYKKIK